MFQTLTLQKCVLLIITVYRVSLYKRLVANRITTVYVNKINVNKRAAAALHTLLEGAVVLYEVSVPYISVHLTRFCR